MGYVHLLCFFRLVCGGGLVLGRALLSLGCLAILSVVGYSLALLSNSDAATWSQKLASARKQSDHLDRLQSLQAQYHERVKELVHNIAQGRCSLTQATDELDDFLLLRLGNRLSVMPVTDAQWTKVLALEYAP